MKDAYRQTAQAQDLAARANSVADRDWCKRRNGRFETRQGHPGDRRGDELPEHLKDKNQRLEWIREQLAARGVALKGRKPARVNTTDPDSRAMKTTSGYVQGFNAQLAVTKDQVIVAADVSSEPLDVEQFQPVVDQALDNLSVADSHQQVQTIVADAGYFSKANVTLDRGPEILIAPVASRMLKSQDPPAASSPPFDYDQELARYERKMAAVNKTLPPGVREWSAPDPKSPDIEAIAAKWGGKP